MHAWQGLMFEEFQRHMIMSSEQSSITTNDQDDTSESSQPDRPPLPPKHIKLANNKRKYTHNYNCRLIGK